MHFLIETSTTLQLFQIKIYDSFPDTAVQYTVKVINMKVGQIIFFLCIGSSSVYFVASSNLCLPHPSFPPQLNVVTQCYGNQENCTVLTDALEQLNSTPVLHLESGIHRLTRYTPISSLQDIFILGSGNGKVTVECNDGIGLSFMNITRLTLCGFTIDGCGLTGDPIVTVKQQLQQLTMLVFGIPSSINYAVVLGSCWNATLSDVIITNTIGMGLLGINVLGNSILHQVSFTYNIRQSCRNNPLQYPFNVEEKGVLEQIGGGAYFLYQDELKSTQNETFPSYNLVIRDSTFSHNAECSYAAITQVNFQQLPGQDLHQVGAGGGLSVFISQREFNVHTLVENSTFTENDARYGAGAHIGIFAGVNLCTVTISGCTFERNGARSLDRVNAGEPRSIGGSGLAIFTDLLCPNKVSRPLPTPERNVSVNVTIHDTDFLSNVAGVEGGGLLVYSLFTTPHHFLSITEPGFYTILINLNNCIFRNNSAQYGVAAYFQQNVHQGGAGSLLLTFSNITCTRSTASRDVDLSSFKFLQEVLRITSAVAVLNVNVVIRGRVEFSDNEVTGVLIQSTPVLVFEGAQVLVMRNSGQQGGGVHIAGEGAGIGFSLNTEVSFMNNTASLYGGAVYVSSSIKSNDVLRPIDSATGCFISPVPVGDCFREDCFGGSLENVSIRFAGNWAPRGSTVYGSTLEGCTWTITLTELNLPISIFEVLYELIDAVDFDVAPVTSAEVSTPPDRLSVLGPDNATSVEVFPGQGINVSVTVFDQFDHVIPATVTSYVLESYANSSLGSSGFFFTESNANTATLRMTGPEDQEMRVIFVELSTLVITTLPIHSLPCLQGFTHIEDRCTCSDQLVGQGVTCDLDALKLHSPNNVWVGNLTANASTDELAISTCYLGYCDAGIKAFRSPHYDEQCRKGANRTGVLCGGCLPGYSVVLGSRECRQCTNTYLLLVPFFGILGIMLFLTIAFLEVTVEKGWMYSIIFYSNVITLSLLSPPLPSAWDIIYVPAHLVSFELGTGVCLYNGMEAIDRVFLKLLFPLYLFILMFIFSLLSKKFTFSGHFSPVKTFVTLGVMSYTSILDTCVEIVTATNLRTVNGERHLRWLSDPNIIYFRGWHCVLVLFATFLFLTYLIPVPLILLFPQIAFKFFKRLGPFFDALWAPFKPKYRWWLGARLVIRAMLFFGTSFLVNVGNILCGLILLIMIEIQFCIRPFSTESVNILDSIIIGDIIALVLGVFFFENNGNNLQKTVYIVTTISFGYALVIGILAHHFSAKYQLRGRVERWYTQVKEARSKNKAGCTANREIPMETIPTADNEGTTSRPALVRIPSHTSLVFTEGDIPLSNNEPVRADYSHFRESLLESQ